MKVDIKMCSALLAFVALVPSIGYSASVIKEGTGGGLSVKLSSDAPAHENPQVEKTTRTARAVKGWNYFYCDSVWTYRKNGYHYVEIRNKDGTYYYSYESTNKPTVTQETMLRACSVSGARYGLRITNVSTGAWDSIVGY